MTEPHRNRKPKEAASFDIWVEMTEQIAKLERAADVHESSQLAGVTKEAAILNAISVQYAVAAERVTAQDLVDAIERFTDATNSGSGAILFWTRVAAIVGIIYAILLALELAQPWWQHWLGAPGVP